MNDKHKNLMLLEEAAETPVAVRFSEDGKFCYCGYSFAGTTSVDSPTWKIKRVEFADSGDMTHATLKKASEAIDTLLAVIQSSDVDLDTVQEIVTFIRSNRGVIDAVSTSKVDKSAYNEFTAKVDNALADIALSLAAKANRNHSHTPAEAGALSSDRTITINGTTKSLKDNPNFAILSNGEASEQWVAVGVQTIMEYIDVNGGVNIFSYAATLGQQRHGDYINTGGNGEELIILNLAYETD
jgi:hypothetical protein